MFKASIIKEVAVRVGDRVGVLSEILAPIAEAKLSLKGIYAASLAGDAVVRLAAENTAKVIDVLKRSGLAPWEQEVLAVEIANEAGAVAEVASKLAAKDIDIRALYASTGVGANTTLFLWTADNAAAIKVLA